MLSGADETQESNAAVEPPAEPSPSTQSSPRESVGSSRCLRRESIPEEPTCNLDDDSDADEYGNDGDEDDGTEYSLEDAAFEPLDDEELERRSPNNRTEPSWTDSLASSTTTATTAMARHFRLSLTSRPTTERRPRRRRITAGNAPTATTPSTTTTSSTTAALELPTCYDERTYHVVSRLRALNKQLQSRLDAQSKHLQHLQDERKQHLSRIQTLEHDCRELRQTLKAFQSTGATTVAVPASTTLELPRVVQPVRPSSHQDRGSPRCSASSDTAPVSPLKAVGSPRPPATAPPALPSPSASKSVSASRSASPGRHRPTASSSSSTASSTTSSSSTSEKLLQAKLEKLEQEKRDLVARHQHQLANYSHELSRLERQVENAQKLVQAKDYELRLQKSRHLYSVSPPSTPGAVTSPTAGWKSGAGHSHSGSTSTGAGAGSTASSASASTLAPHPHAKTLLTDSLWRDLMPTTPPASNLLTLPFTSHVGLAFEQLLGHPLLSFHDNMVDATTRAWLHEIRTCGFQMMQLHHRFQCMALTLRRLAQCTHIYQLAEAFTEEVQTLTQAEQAFLFVMDPSENEFWCRVPRASSTGPGTSASTSGASASSRPKTSPSSIPASAQGSTDMITVRSRVMPITGMNMSAVAAEHTGTTSAQQAAMLAAQSGHAVAPCGLASWVYHTKKPLLLAAGHVTKHTHFSTAPDNTDRLMAFKSASTLLLPVLHGSTVLGVVQVCGKLTQVAALGVCISLERCDSFTTEDQVVVTMLAHFLSGILPKVAYFTEVESNKVNEETLIQLAPEIFTCLRFEELGKVVIQNAKEILDADRCSLFVADNAERMLFNWQSDISGRGGVEVFEDIKRSGMSIPFGHGIVGMVAETRQLINIPDAYEDPRFNSSWDKKTNYRTKSILTVPILTSTTTSAAGLQPIRRRRSQHDVYGTVIVDKDSKKADSPTDDPSASSSSSSSSSSSQAPTQTQTLLGVVQVINKSGGAPFRSKDEFLLQTISKLIALAIENSQLFQKTQELCAGLGKLIADADLVDAIASLGASAELIIGVECAAIYVLDPLSSGMDLVTFHRKRRHKIVVKEQMYRHSLLEQALVTRDLVIVNDIAQAPSYNAYVDSIGGVAARNVLFMPLLIDDPDDAPSLASLTSPSLLSTPGSAAAASSLPSASLNGKKLIGVLHLVNTRGRKLRFERHDLFLSIVSSQTCSAIASILEKQGMLRQKDQTQHLLDTSLSFFKEMSPIGIINAVYNTCASLFPVEKAHLFLWDLPKRGCMWTAKLSPTAESVSAAMAAATTSPTSLSSSSSHSSSSHSSSASSLAVVSPPPSLRAQARRISVLADQKIRVPTTEGLFEHVLAKGSLVIVKNWVDIALEDDDEGSLSTAADDDADSEDAGASPEAGVASGTAAAPVSSSPKPRRSSAATYKHAVEVGRFGLRACRSDYKAGFTDHAVVACPLWDVYTLDVIGILVLLFPKGRVPPLSELANLPMLTRQISGALNVCGDLGAVTRRSRQLQDMLEWTPRRPTAVPTATALASLSQSATTPLPITALTMTITLGSRGQLVSFSQPINVGTPGFSASALYNFNASSGGSNGVQTRADGVGSSSGGGGGGFAAQQNFGLSRLAMDDEGHRWVFLLSGASLQEMCHDHYVSWIGKGLGATTTSPTRTNLSSSSSSVSTAFDRLRTDLQSVYARKDTVHGVLHLPPTVSVSSNRRRIAQGHHKTSTHPANESSSAGYGIPRSAQLQMRVLLWSFVDAQWRIDTTRALELFDGVDPMRSRQLTREQLEKALTTSGRGISLDQMEWDLFHAHFADPETDLVSSERLVEELAPQFHPVPCIAYELVPVLDSVTQSVVSVHILLTASTHSPPSPVGAGDHRSSSPSPRTEELTPTAPI
ncbi:hypothetical protein PINS_up012464 [Pythium insidiosum]|nr:hypothetical protein PINS_up012464 [Pythium insidiosum]